MYYNLWVIFFNHLIVLECIILVSLFDIITTVSPKTQCNKLNAYKVGNLLFILFLVLNHLWMETMFSQKLFANFKTCLECWVKIQNSNCFVFDKLSSLYSAKQRSNNKEFEFYNLLLVWIRIFAQCVCVLFAQEGKLFK